MSSPNAELLSARTYKPTAPAKMSRPTTTAKIQLGTTIGAVTIGAFGLNCTVVSMFCATPSIHAFKPLTKLNGNVFGEKKPLSRKKFAIVGSHSRKKTVAVSAAHQ